VTLRSIICSIGDCNGGLLGRSELWVNRPVGLHAAWLGRTSLVAVGISVVLMVVSGVLGPSAAVPDFPAAPPWPPWFISVHPAAMLVVLATWGALLTGVTGLVLGLRAARRGWRPRPRRLIIGSVLAVAALMVVPPIGSADMVLYASFGRTAALGHNPYVFLPKQLKAAGDPVGTAAGLGYLNAPPRYGPVAIVSEMAASELAGDSTARTIFWLKVWNGLAYLAVGLALDWLVRLDGTRRGRVHLLWTVNPLMLWAVMAGGHNDGLAVGMGAVALLGLRSTTARRAVPTGIFLGLAMAIKPPLAVFGTGLAWAARQSPRRLAALAAGSAAVLLPSYLLSGRIAISASTKTATLAPVGYTPWFAAARVLGWQHEPARIGTLGLMGFALMVIVLLWRLPRGSREFPAARVILAVALAWLITTPQQHPWYFAMIFPVLAMMPASRLDWIILLDSAAAAAAGLPRLLSVTYVHPAWLSSAAQIAYAGIFPFTITVASIALLWLCLRNSWRPPGGLAEPLVDVASDGPESSMTRGGERERLAADPPQMA
jgi:hypothetical protein